MNFSIFLERKVIAPILIVIFGILFYTIINKIIIQIFKIQEGKMDERKRKTIRSIILNVWKYFVLIVCTLMILGEYGLDTKTIIASFGLLGAVLGLALQDTLKDIVSGFFIIIEDQFRVGDTVSIDDFKGEVIAIGLKTTKIKAYTGEIKIIANRLITSVINYSINKSLAIVDVEVSYDDNIEKVEMILKNLCNRLNDELTLTNGEVELLGIEDLGSNGIKFRLVAPSLAMKHFEVQRKIRREVILEFERNNITIPFEQVVIHNEK